MHVKFASLLMFFLSLTNRSISEDHKNLQPKHWEIDIFHLKRVQYSLELNTKPINNLHILMHTMFGPEFNKKQLLETPQNLKDQQIRSVIEELSL